MCPGASRRLILGREHSLGVVAAMVDLPIASCLGPIDEAVEAGLLEATAYPGELRFAHAVIRDAIEAGLGTPERVRLHRRAAQAIEEFYADRLDPHLFDLAGHWTAAVAAVDGDRSRAMGWIQRAGQEAMRRNAYEEAARWFGVALDVGAAELDALGRCHLLLALGEALHLSGDVAGGLAACLEATGVAEGIGRADLMAEAALVTEPTFDPRADLLIRQLCEKALAALGSQHPA